ncbi:MAG: response regulator transcription factor [Planctomycetes bacterium]|nr:response regulator transcription factor [Planctomycetota bacterium]
MVHNNGTIKVLVTDDHQVFRVGLAGVFDAEPDITVVGEAIDGQEAIIKAKDLKPDVVIMDLLMPQCDGMEATAAIRQSLPETKVLMLTISEREDHLFQALKSGAHGFISKDANVEEIVDAVRGVACGKVMLSPPLATKFLDELREDYEQPSISRREMQVLKLLGEGLTNSQISKQLCIGESTVRSYIHRLLEKLRLKNRDEATSYAIHHYLN